MTDKMFDNLLNLSNGGDIIDYIEQLEKEVDELNDCIANNDKAQHFFISNQEAIIKKLENVLQELVDKATPIKPIKDEPSQIRYVQTYKCPKCGGSFSGTISKYCYHCGQAIDWSSE